MCNYTQLEIFEIRAIMRKNSLQSCPELRIIVRMEISADLLKRARHAAEMTQHELATKLGVSLRTIVNWEAENGSVPERSRGKVEQLLGPHMNQILRMDAHISSSMDRRKNPDSLVLERKLREAEISRHRLIQESMSAQESEIQNAFPDGERTTGIDGPTRKRKILSLFTDHDLMMELINRSRWRGQSTTPWNTSALEVDNQRLAILREVVPDLLHFVPDAVADIDPDYSNLSAEDARNSFDLAAKEADPNIGHDELPHEP